MEASARSKNNTVIISLIAATILEGFLLIAGYIYATTWAPGQGNPIFDPVPSVVETHSLGNLAAFFSLTGYNLLTQLGILFFSFIHLGLIAVAFLSIRVFYLGAAIGWFGNFPGLSVTDGILSYLPHAIFEIPATFIMAVLSVWIGLEVVKSDDSSSRWERVNQRYKAVLKYILVIVLLLVTAAIIESTVSIPKAFSSAQSAEMSEARKQIQDPQESWSMQVPVSWQEQDMTKSQFANPKVMLIEAEHHQLYINVMTFKQQGMSTLVDLKTLFQGNYLQRTYSNMGLSTIDSVEDGYLGSYEAIKVTGSGIAPQTSQQKVRTTAYFTVRNNNEKNETLTYGIFFWINPTWHPFTSYLLEDIPTTFHID